MKEKLKTEHTQTAQEALKDVLKVFQAATTSGLSNGSSSYIENTLTEMAPKVTLDYLFIKNLKRWSQAAKCLETFTQRVIKSTSSTDAVPTYLPASKTSNK